MPAEYAASNAYVRKVCAKADIRGRRWEINRWIVDRLDTLAITVHSCDRLWAWSDEEAGRKIRKPDSWSTFTECFNYTLRSTDNGEYKLDVTVWKGDSLYGTPDYVRFTCTVEVPHECLHVFHKDAERALARYLEAAWEAHEDRRRARWMAKKTAEVLGDD